LSGPPRRIAVPYPLAQGSDAATSVIVNWLTSPSTDGMEALAMEVLSELLLGHDGAFLAKALRDSDLGEDLSPQCGLDTGFRQMVFSAGLRGVELGREGEIEDLVVDTVADIASRGFPSEALDAAMHSILFANREIRRGAGAYGLRLFNRAIRGWLHGSAPESTLSFEAAAKALGARLADDHRYLESLAETYLIGNDHRSTVTVYPDPGLLERMRDESGSALAREAQALSPEARDAIRDAATRLAAAQEKPDGPEAIDTLPRLSIRDLPRTVERIERETGTIAALPSTIHPIFTNGIVYLDLAFPLDGAPPEVLAWLPLLSRFVSGAGLPGRPYYEISELLARRAGGFSASLDSATPIGGRKARSFAVFRLKTLAENFGAALELALALISGADYGDAARAG
ncbi:MAG: insulinase family protein, partial [Spirochaetaceae bacterium]|nr:insulinase family protein [Spirochaetaceae bacterium]